MDSTREDLWRPPTPTLRGMVGNGMNVLAVGHVLFFALACTEFVDERGGTGHGSPAKPVPLQPEEEEHEDVRETVGWEEPADLFGESS